MDGIVSCGETPPTEVDGRGYYSVPTSSHLSPTYIPTEPVSVRYFDMKTKESTILSRVTGRLGNEQNDDGL